MLPTFQFSSVDTEASALTIISKFANWYKKKIDNNTIKCFVFLLLKMYVIASNPYGFQNITTENEFFIMQQVTQYLAI